GARPPLRVTGDAHHRYIPLVRPRTGQVGPPASCTRRTPGSRRHHVKKILPAFAAGAAALLALSACGGGDDADAASEVNGVQLVTAGQLTLCSDIPYEPFEFVQEGENVGFDIDLAQATADSMGVELEVITTAFEAIQSGSALDTNQCAVALPGMTTTAARQTQLDFSQPYLKDNLALMTTKDSDIESIEDIKGEEAGVQHGSEFDAEHGRSGHDDLRRFRAGPATRCVPW